MTFIKLELSLSLSSQVALSVLLWLWWFFAIFPDRSPVVMHQQCPAWSTLSNPGTRSLLVCPFSACLSSFLASVFSPYRSSGRCGQITESSSPTYSSSTSKQTQSSPTPIYSFSSPSMTPWAVFDNTTFRKHQHASCHHLSSPMIPSRKWLWEKQWP